MTKEEAMRNINALNAVCSDKGFYDSEFKEALRMAIEALKGGDAEMSPLQKPTTTPMQQSPSDGADLISREDAVKAIHKYFVEAIDKTPHEVDEDGDDVYTDMKSVNALFHHNKMVSRAIKALPSADAVQGEWILVKGSNGKDYHKCSKCLHTQEITGVKNYCAVCGTRMKGGDTE